MEHQAAVRSATGLERVATTRGMSLHTICQIEPIGIGYVT
jgi:hypothetical protein